MLIRSLCHLCQVVNALMNSKLRRTAGCAAAAAAREWLPHFRETAAGMVIGIKHHRNTLYLFHVLSVIALKPVLRPFSFVFRGFSQKQKINNYNKINTIIPILSYQTSLVALCIVSIRFSGLAVQNTSFHSGALPQAPACRGSFIRRGVFTAPPWAIFVLTGFVTSHPSCSHVHIFIPTGSAIYACALLSYY